MPPWAFTQSAHAGATVAAWLLLDACEPVSETIIPSLIGDPVGAVEPDVEPPLLGEVDFCVLLVLLHAATSAAATTPTAAVCTNRLPAIELIMDSYPLR
jgi:hypothetical protein